MIQAYAAHKQGAPLTEYHYDPGPLENSEVEIDVMYCGICHSDLSMIDNAWGMSQYPLVAGHEVIGKVKTLGKNVNNFSVGQTVGLGWHCGYCNDCHCCKSGHPNLCQKAKATIVQHHGGFADTVRADSNSVVAIPEGIDLESAGPLFCGGITVFNPLIQFDVKPTDKVAVIGIGGLGHMAIQFLNAWGCEVTAFTHQTDKKATLIEMGAHHVLNSTNAKEIEEASGQFDFILSTVNAKLDWNLYLNTLKPQGRLHVVGAVLEPLDISAFALIMGQRQISGSPVGSPENIGKMLDFADQHQIKPIIETYKMSQVNEAISRLKSGKTRYRIVLTNEH